MATLPAWEPLPLPRCDRVRGEAANQRHARWAAGLAVVGVVSIWPTVLLLWALWTTDPLKSIGGLLPLVSLVLIWRVWRALRWQTHGSWWGLALLLVTVAAVHLRDRAVLELVLSPSWAITLPPHGLVAFAYGSAAVLLFGGVRLWRAAVFPLGLLFLVNPVPHAFVRLLDLPLQHASATVARGLAHALGQRLTPDQLTLMFTPEFGMFIAPGCDGIRGALTMGLIAAVAGYLYGFRRRVWAGTVLAAVGLGYLFNLLRLCVLVLYYVLALRWHPLESRAGMADYCLGATLFFFATMLLFAALRRWGAGEDLRIRALRLADASPREPSRAIGFWQRWGAFAALVAFASVPYARARLNAPRQTGSPDALATPFPQSIGPYRLRRTWPERLVTGQTIFTWAEYARPRSDEPVLVGISPVLGAHDTLLCHTARGEDWLWHGSLSLRSVQGPVSFSASLYNDGATEYMEATTLCSPGAGCGQWASPRSHFGLVYSRPDLGGLLRSAPAQPIPVLLRVNLPIANAPEEAARLRLAGDLQDFLVNASLGRFTDNAAQP